MGSGVKLLCYTNFIQTQFSQPHYGKTSNDLKVSNASAEQKSEEKKENYEKASNDLKESNSAVAASVEQKDKEISAETKPDSKD